MTLEEKYKKLCEAVRAMAKRGSSDGYDPYYGYDPEYYNGKDAGISSMADDAREALESVSEKVE